MESQAFDFTSAVISYRDSLRYFALSLTHENDEANDLLQETMLKAFIHQNRFEENTNLKAWLYTIMKNIFINNYRRLIKKRTVIDTSRELYYINLPQFDRDNNNPESKMAVKEMRAEIEKLSPDFRTPIEMYFEGYKYKEIADHMKLPIGTIKSRIFLARKQLTGLLRSEMDVSRRQIH